VTAGRRRERPESHQMQRPPPADPFPHFLDLSLERWLEFPKPPEPSSVGRELEAPSSVKLEAYSAVPASILASCCI
jgi:hypothetical protein